MFHRVPASALLAVFLLALGISCSDSSRDDGATEEIRLNQTTVSFRLLPGFGVVDREHIDDPDGDKSVVYLVRGEDTPPTTYDLMVSVDEQGITTHFDVDRPLREQLGEEAEALRAVGYQVSTQEILTVDGREGLVIKAETPEGQLLRAFIPVDDAGSVGLLGVTTNDVSSRGELLFDTALDTLTID